MADPSGLEVDSKNARGGLVEQVNWLESRALEIELLGRVQVLVLTRSEV